MVYFKTREERYMKKAMCLREAAGRFFRKAGWDRMHAMHRKHGRLFNSYLLTYLAVLIIPVLSSFFFYQNTFQIIRSDIERENDSLMA